MNVRNIIFTILTGAFSSDRKLDEKFADSSKSLVSSVRSKSNKESEGSRLRFKFAGSVLYHISLYIYFANS